MGHGSGRSPAFRSAHTQAGARGTPAAQQRTLPGTVSALEDGERPVVNISFDATVRLTSRTRWTCSAVTTDMNARVPRTRRRSALHARRRCCPSQCATRGERLQRQIHAVGNLAAVVKRTKPHTDLYLPALCLRVEQQRRRVRLGYNLCRERAKARRFADARSGTALESEAFCR